MARGSAPGERRGGRQAGTPNRKTNALREAIEAEGVDPAVALVRIARSAEEREDYALAVEAYGKVVGFLHARPKPVDTDPDALIELERALIRVKLEETANALKSDDTLADRLARAKKRRLASEVFEVFDALTDAADDLSGVIDATPAPGPAPRPTMHEPIPTVSAPAPLPQPVPAVAPDYRPILPRHEPPRWPNRDEGRVQVEYDPTAASYHLP